MDPCFYFLLKVSTLGANVDENSLKAKRIMECVKSYSKALLWKLTINTKWFALQQYKLLTFKIFGFFFLKIKN